ncbi:MAG: PASTA domain-containing protein [Calditrichaceae bacterium]|jgi:serine/threonine-protein kinase
MRFFSGLVEKYRTSIFYKILFWFIIFIIFVLVMDKLVMPAYVRLGQEVELPDVVEMSGENAKRTLENKGFHGVITDSVYDTHYDVGMVVEQMPPAFSTVKKGRHVYLTVSIGEKPIIMPNLFYISPRDAELTLQSYNLELGAKHYEYDNSSPEGVVIAQSYPQGQKVKRGTRINITISLGPLPERRTVPQLVGKSLDEASSQLKILGVDKIKITYEEKANILPKTVLNQSIKPGTLVDEEKEIELTVSKIEKSEE